MLLSPMGLVFYIAVNAAVQPAPAWAPSAPSESAPAPRAFKLKPHQATGGYVYETAAFVALVFPDGSVDFRSGKPGSGGGIPLRVMPFPLNYKPEPLPPGTPTLVGEIGKLIGKRPASDRPPKKAEAPVPSVAHTLAEATLLCEEPKARCFVDQRGTASLVAVSGPLDTTEEVMRMLGDDPHRYEKARFLATTADFRTKLAERTRKRELRDALAQLPALLNRIWRTAMLTREQRINIIASLRDEVDPVAAGGESALALIDDFIQKHELKLGSKPAAPKPQ